MRLSHGHQTAIDTQIILRHAPRGEAFLKATSDFLAGQMSEPVNCADRAADVLHNETGYAVVDHFHAEPRLNAITGVPQAIASIMTRPNGSGQSIGTNNVIAPL